MPVVVKLISWANGRSLGVAGQYIKSVNVQQAPHTPEWLQTTPELSEALRWATALDFFHTYREVLKFDPVRPDGRPNRPLTALNLEINKVEE